MKQIYKYPIELADEFTIDLPRGAQVLTAQAQGNKPFFWAAVEPGNMVKGRRFRVIGTGHPVHDFDDLVYINTFQLHDGGLVFHFFEKLR